MVTELMNDLPRTMFDNHQVDAYPYRTQCLRANQSASCPILRRPAQSITGLPNPSERNHGVRIRLYMRLLLMLRTGSHARLIARVSSLRWKRSGSCLETESFVGNW